MPSSWTLSNARIEPLSSSIGQPEALDLIRCGDGWGTDRVRAGCLIALLPFALMSAPVYAQVDAVVTVPPNIVLTNYDTVPVGPFGGLEGAAVVARVGDPSAAWFNPAGLARQNTAQISGSAGVYQQTSITPEALPNSGGSLQQLPNFVGVTFAVNPRITAGAALLTNNAWTQETDSELISTVASGQQRFAYSADSDFERRVLAFGAGYHGDGPWRLGGGLAFSIMSLRLVQTASDRIGDSSGLKSLLVTARASGSAIQLRSQAGAQYDTSQWRFGAAIRTPGLTLHRSGGVTLDGVLDAGASSLGASVFDADAAFEYHLPWEFQTGAAWLRDRFEVELDLDAFSSIAAYPLIATDKPAVIYGDAAAGRPPTIITQPFAGFTSASDGVFNVNAGGHVRLVNGRDVRLHAGVGNSQSPVAADDMVFNRVDLVTWTLGLSGTFGKFQFAAGFNQQRGTANDVTLRNLLNGRVVQSAMDVRMSGFIYSLAYQF
ncbi:MAG TPA: hypothetical protein VKE51_39910 [Vicinamibacterales bacterium]|nr:hypothetical protein [Vicinamibacterales bacterium]